MSNSLEDAWRKWTDGNELDRAWEEWIDYHEQSKYEQLSKPQEQKLEPRVAIKARVNRILKDVYIADSEWKQIRLRCEINY
jgi:hypothetical protein